MAADLRSSEGQKEHPLFGRLRRDASVEGLIGTAPVIPIEIPIQFTQMSDVVTNHLEAATAMRDAVELCTLLDYQKDVIKNTFLHRAALIQHLFTRVIPLPLPDNHPEKQQRCFWATQNIRYADQADILRLLDMLCRQYCAVSLSLNVTRSFDAVRMLILGCMACVGDCVLRMTACDRPSKFSLHYAGNMAGPVQAFGFDMGYYAMESETACFTEPELTTARTQLLDYFYQQRKTLRDDHIIFAFEEGMELSAGDRQLMNQLALSTGYKRVSQEDEDLMRMLSGEDREILDYFPELGFFRDIVFYFKTFFVPTSDLLPELKHWTPIEAALEWTSKDDGLKVRGFGKDLQCTGFVKHGEDKRNFFKKLFNIGQPRAPPSGSDPSALLGEKVETEDDVLYIKNLPTFGGTLGSRQAELLIQYLTAPYLRIPLVLGFFSDQMRIKALGSLELQDVLDSIMFEPGRWQAEYEKTMPTKIPSSDPDLSATPVGLLFNELMLSPTTVVNALENMADYVLELDEGKWNPNTSAYILYVLRLLVRVEGFIKTVLDHESSTSQAQSGSGSSSAVRGLEIRPANLEILKAAYETIKVKTRLSLFPLVETWCKRVIKDKLMSEASILWSHLAYIYLHVLPTELNADVAGTLLTAQLFLHNNYHFDAEKVDEGSKRSAATDDAKRSLGIPQTEVFSMFQKHRRTVFKWLIDNPDACNEAMEGVIRVMTFTGWRTQTNTQLEPRAWQSMDKPGYVGRFQPDTEVHDDEAVANAMTDYEEWLRYTTTVAVETEINVQIGSFTLHKEQMELLPPAIYNDRDFLNIFGTEAQRFGMQCAVVKNTTNRKWLRLVGRRHDVQLWNADDRILRDHSGTPKNPCRRTFKYPRGLSSSESWVQDVIEPALEAYKDTMHLSIQSDSCPENFCRLAGRLFPEQVGSGDARQQSDEPLREIIVTRDPPVVQVFNVVEHGRRWYRQLTYVSIAGECIHDMKAKMKDAGGYVAEPHFEQGSVEHGTYWTPSSSLVITRNIKKAIGKQTYIPARLLFGVVPDALLQEYEMWQSEDDNLIGHQREAFRSRAAKPSRLEMNLQKIGGDDVSGFCCSEATAVITKVFEEDSTGDAEEPAPEVDSVESHMLINLLYRSDLAPLRRICSRIDNMAYVLAWKTSDGPSPVDRIDFPRIQISFEIKNGRMFSVEHPGYFISDFRSRELDDLLRGIPNALLFEREDNSHRGSAPMLKEEQRVRQCSVMIPAGAKPRRPYVPSAPWSCSVVLERSNAAWCSNLQSDLRHYLYTIHLSGTFLTPTSLASTLYMLLLRWMSRRYDKVFQLLPSCFSDTKMEPHEQQIFDLLAGDSEYREIADDGHPDSIACKLKLLSVTNGAETTISVKDKDGNKIVQVYKTMEIRIPEGANSNQWRLEKVMSDYTRKRTFVSARCRLTVEPNGGEELELFEMIDDSALDAAMRNRR